MVCKDTACQIASQILRDFRGAVFLTALFDKESAKSDSPDEVVGVTGV